MRAKRPAPTRAAFDDLERVLRQTRRALRLARAILVREREMTKDALQAIDNALGEDD